MLTTRSLDSTLDPMMSLNRVLVHAMNGSGLAILPTGFGFLHSTSWRSGTPTSSLLSSPSVSRSAVVLSFEQNVLTDQLNG